MQNTRRTIGRQTIQKCSFANAKKAISENSTNEFLFSDLYWLWPCEDWSDFIGWNCAKSDEGREFVHTHNYISMNKQMYFFARKEEKRGNNNNKITLLYNNGQCKNNNKKKTFILSTHSRIHYTFVECATVAYVIVTINAIFFLLHIYIFFY